MLTNRKYSGRRPLVVVAALLSLMILLPLAGCKNDTVPEPTRYTVKFDKNAKDATGEMASQTFTDGVEQELSANRFKRDTWKFSGWSEDKAATTATYRDKDKFKATKDTTLYAVWTDNGTVSPVTFTPADGTTLYYGDTVTLATATEGATIQYKLGDGSWQDYDVETKIQVTTSTTITAKAIKDGLKDSTEIKATYTLRQLTGITPPTRTVYSVGDSFDRTGMKVTATYDGGATRTVTGIITTDTSTLTESAGVKTVAVSYKEGEIEESGQFEIRVLPKKLTDYTSPNHTDGSWIYVELGEWPQTIMADGVTVDETKSKTVGMFTYYLGSDGNYYVKQEEKAHEANYTYSDGTAVGQGGSTSKYFKVEPIVWRVLNKDYTTTGNALLLAEKILTGGIMWADSRNNYMESNIRKWLNGNSGTGAASDYNGTGFLQSAFTADAQNLIAATTVDNSAASTNPASNSQVWNSGNNPYACDNTTDKIFLLSEKEATTDTYGFAAYDQADTTRIRFTTDYAKATGSEQDSSAGYGGWWWLRSPYCSGVDYARFISSGGDAGDYHFVDNASEGVVPALCVELR